MISEDLLERGFAVAGEAYDVPERGTADILDQLRPADTGADEISHRSWRGWRPSGRTWLLSSAAAVVVLVIVAFVVGGGNGSGANTRINGAGVSTEKGLAPLGAPAGTGGDSAGGTGSAAVGAPVPSTVTLPAERGPLQHSSGSTTSTPAQAIAPDSLTKVQKTGEVYLQVDKIKVSDAVTRLGLIAAGAGGIVSDSETSEGSDPSATVTLRMPVSSFEAVLGQVRGLGKVLSQETKATDVTAQYVDLQARLTSLRQTRDVYLRILTKATTIGEILSVQQQINGVQTQIEQLQGQLKVLTDQTTFGTLTVSVNQKAAPTPVVQHQSGMSRAFHRSVNRFVHGIEAIVGVIGPVLLVVLVLLLGWLVAKVGYRVVRRQMV